LKLLYVVICLVLFVVVMSAAAHVMVSNGEWGYGFAWGIGIGCIVGAFAGTIERKEKAQGARDLSAE
jgi:ABC-type nitrate/sulfonate/bicarbonate transport system permease component